MNQFRISDVARSDLNEIWLYIAQDNLDAADKLIYAIVSRFPKLAAMPFKRFSAVIRVIQFHSHFFVSRCKFIRSTILAIQQF